MKFFKNLVFICLIASLFICSGCKKAPIEKIGFGTLENSVYRNDYFNLSITLPSDWHALDDEARKDLMSQGRQLITGESKNLKAIVDASELNSVNLLSVFKHPLGSPIPYNPSLICVAEKVSHAPGIKRGSDYLYHMKKLIEMGQISYVFSEDIYSQNIGGISFDVQDAEVNIGTIKVKQKYFAAIIKGYALGFVISFTTDEEEKGFQQILADVNFQK